MSMPTQPTAATITTEALKRFLNGGTPDTDEVTRATDYGLESVKRDIMNLGKRWKPLESTIYQITKVGVSHYDNPADFEDNASAGIMSGSHTGTLTNVASAQIMTLGIAENATQGEAEGKYLLITSGNGANQAQVIDDYNPSTRVATLQAALTNLPNITDGYIVVNSIDDLTKISNERYEQYKYPGVPDIPCRYAEISNDTVGQIVLHPVPNAVYGIKRRYFIDLMKLDLSSTRYLTILRRWASVFEQGVYAWKLGEDDDRYTAEYQKYQSMLVALAAHDLSGFNPEKLKQMSGGE